LPGDGYQTQIEIAKRVGLGNETDLSRLDGVLTRVSQMLRGLIRSIKADTET